MPNLPPGAPRQNYISLKVGKIMLFNQDAGKRLFGAVSFIAILLAWSVQASGADTYSGGQLKVPSLAIGNATYSDVIVDISALLGGPAGTGPAGSIDTYNPLTGQLSAQAVTLGSTTVYNGLATVGKVISIASVSGADTYNGAELSIPYAEVNGTIYTNAVVTISAIVNVANGMPSVPWDSYNPASKQLTIAAVTYAGKVYTNVTVTINSVVSVGGGGTAQAISFPTPSFSGPQFHISQWATLDATASSGLPVTYYVTTPSNCGFYNTTAQEQYIYVSYAAAGEAGSGVLGGPMVATNVIQANTLSGTATMVSGQSVSLPMGLLTQLTPFPNTDPGYIPPYPNFHFGPANNGWVYDDVVFFNGGPVYDAAGLAIQVPGDIINLYYNAPFFYYVDAIGAFEGLTGGFASFAPQGKALVGLSAGMCQITAFQSGNGSFASAPPVTVTLSVH